MSLAMSEQLANLRHHARLLVERTGDHNDLVHALVASAERDLRQVETAAADATTADIDEARVLLSRHVRRTAAGAATARQLCVTAHAQHAAACRLLADLDDGHAGARRPNAVLVVDDYGEVRELVASLLRNAGFVVRTAANGLEGLIAAYEMRPGIIVMDVSMPVLDGIEATRLIKAGEATRDARVIAYTANPSFDGAAVPELFVAVLQKPAPPEVVVATVQHVASL